MSRQRSAIVTGSTSGIGLGIATAFARQGMNLMLNGFGDRREIGELCRKLSDNHGVEVCYSDADMSRPEQIEAMVEQARRAFDRVDVLVNNAGIQHVQPVDEFPADKWDAILAINLSSAFHTIRHCLGDMKAQGWGRVINLASAHGLVASPYKSAYVAAKHGMVGLTKAVALEVAEQGITVNAICPGYVLTPLVEKQIPDTARARGLSEEAVKREVLLKAQPTKKFVTVEQLGEMALFLCSDAAASITGAALPVEGGWTAQ